MLQRHALFSLNRLHFSKPKLSRAAGTPFFFRQRFHKSRTSYAVMKRSAAKSNGEAKPKRQRVQLPDYESADQAVDESGDIVWPAPNDQIETARNFIQECAKSEGKILIVPDKDADGLSSGVILMRTLELLGVSSDRIAVHHLSRGVNLHDESERESMKQYKPDFIFVLDQGSRPSPPVIDDPHQSLIIDHHYAVEGDFPQGAKYINACHCPPVVTSSLLTYLLCEPLHPEVKEKTDWLCCIGTHGDLGTTLKWKPPFPDMKETFKKYNKKNINDAVSMVNAPRRTPAFNVSDAWRALRDATCPADLLTDQRLLQAREEISLEIERCTHAAPKFSYDGRVSVQRISSLAQVHPVIATRWAGFLKSSKLEVVLVANEGYLPGFVNFSCRIAREARVKDPPVNIIEILKEYARNAEDDLLERLGESFARGHKEASGGIVPKDAFEDLMKAMRVGEKPEKKEIISPKKEVKVQKNTLMGWVVKKKETETETDVSKVE